MDNTANPRETLRETIVERMLDGRQSPTELAVELGLDLEQLAEQVAQPTVRRTFTQMVWLSEIRAQLLVSSYRAMAAARLATLASATEATELARRSCVDLLKLDLTAFEMPAESEPVGIDEEAALHRVLESLGEGGIAA
ncbi:MAG: hypothetical protein AAF432_06410 [Planctomycetota bacterium]